MLGTTLAGATRLHQDDALASLVDTAAEPADLRRLAELLEGQVPPHILDAAASPVWQQQSSELLAEARDLAKNLAWLPNTVAPAVLERDLAPVHTAAVDADRFGFLGLGRTKRRRAVITKHFGSNWRGTETDTKNLVPILESLVEARARCAGIVAGFAEIPEIRLGRHWNPFSEEDINSVAGQREKLVHLASPVR